MPPIQRSSRLACRPSLCAARRRRGCGPRANPCLFMRQTSAGGPLGVGESCFFAGRARAPRRSGAGRQMTLSQASLGAGGACENAAHERADGVGDGDDGVEDQHEDAEAQRVGAEVVARAAD